MQLGELYRYYQAMNASRILMSFKGAISQELLVELGSLVKHQLQNDEKIQRLFAVFVEMSQNILHYSAEKETFGDDGHQVGVGVIVISETDAAYSVSAGNLASVSEAERLRDRCTVLNTKSKDELKKLYQEQRKQPAPSGSKGAGLGLIDMVRKADEPVQCDVNTVSTDTAFCTLNVVIHKTLKT
jgi:hypothetical protein